MNQARAAILRAQCFFAALAYPATRFELVSHAETEDCGVLVEDAELAIDTLVAEGVLVYAKGRYVFAGSDSLIAEHREREALFPRKIHRAKAFARFLARLSGVKAAFVCNTLALAHASEESDIDFFIVCKKNTVWQTRFLATLYLMLRHWRVEGAKRDPICLTFFVDEQALDLAPLAIENDVYLRHWFLFLLPLFDDGISEKLWQSNVVLRTYYPLASSWLPLGTMPVPRFRLPTVVWFEKWSRALSEWRFAAGIRARLNKGTDVIANDHVLKFHTDDRRAEYRNRYLTLCKTYDV
ncbi:MAG: hypothetical protein U0487_00860 [Patescibacteria group bacterium]